jgi:hypothetical protein
LGRWLEAINQSKFLWWLIAAAIFFVALNATVSWLANRSAQVDSDLDELDQLMRARRDDSVSTRARREQSQSQTYTDTDTH